MEKISLYKEQLSRMRSMNRYYHDQFLLDVRILFIFNTIFIFLSFNNKNALYLIPLISLLVHSFEFHAMIFKDITVSLSKKNGSEYTRMFLFVIKKLFLSYTGSKNCCSCT